MKVSDKTPALLTLEFMKNIYLQIVKVEFTEDNFKKID